VSIGRESETGGGGALPPPPIQSVHLMTKAQTEALQREVEQMAAAGAGRNEFREWADAYYFGIEDLYEVVKLMVDELDGHRQTFHEAQRPGGN
jgi:hypothetical protein